jgi:hypothetical protein
VGAFSCIAQGIVCPEGMIQSIVYLTQTTMDPGAFLDDGNAAWLGLSAVLQRKAVMVGEQWNC